MRPVPAELPERFGSYLLVKRLGQGGMGDVCLARPLSLRQGVPDLVVVKRIRKELLSRDDFLRRFRHEAAIATKLEHPHVARVYDVGAVGEVLYITLEYIDGWALIEVMERLHGQRRPASLASVADVIDGALRGLEALHAVKDPETGEPLEFVHRDLAPKNIMLGRDGKTRLIDLGLGKSTIQDWKTSTGVLMGSLGYMAPEQVRAEKIDQRTDLYAMGIVLWEFLTLARYIQKGSTPLTLQASLSPEFRPPSALRSDVSKALDGVVRRAVAVDPEKRFQSAYEFRHALRQAVPGWEPQQDMSTLISEFVKAEDAGRHTEIAQLLTIQVPMGDDMPTKMKTVVYAQAPGVTAVEESDVEAPTAPARPSAKMQAEISGETTAAASDEHAMPPVPIIPIIPMGTPPHSNHPMIGVPGQPYHVVYVPAHAAPVPFSRKVLLATSIAAVVITAVVAGLTVGKSLMVGKRPATAIKPVPTVVADAPVGRANDEPGATGGAPTPKTSAAAPAPPDRATPAPEVDGEPAPKRSVRRRPKKRKRAAAAKKATPKKKKKKKALPQSRDELVRAVDDLSKRAEDAARSLPASAPKAKRLNRIRAELLLVLSTNDLARAAAKVHRLERELADLQR